MPVPEARRLHIRLLNLYPATTVKDHRHVTEPGTKDDAIEAVVDNSEDVEELLEFVVTYFGRLHQHVYVFRWDGEELDPEAPFNEPPIRTVAEDDERHHYYLLRRTYELVLDDPLEYSQLDFSWPVKIVEAPDHLRVHFTIMAKSPAAYVGGDRGIVRAIPHPKEDSLLEGLQMTAGIGEHASLMDLNRGVKALWDADEIDSPAVKYKRARATSKDVMDEEFLVKADDPERYRELWDKPLFKTTFVFLGEDDCVDYFNIDPSNGKVTFRRYSATDDCVDNVIRTIVEAN